MTTIFNESSYSSVLNKEMQLFDLDGKDKTYTLQYLAKNGVSLAFSLKERVRALVVEEREEAGYLISQGLEATAQKCKGQYELILSLLVPQLKEAVELLKEMRHGNDTIKVGGKFAVRIEACFTDAVKRINEQFLTSNKWVGSVGTTSCNDYVKELEGYITKV